MSDRLTTSGVAKLLGVSSRTVEGWRLKSQGPPYTRLGGRIVYSRAEVNRWLDGRTVKPMEGA
jgi:excisionase family DNA binding protein